MRKLVLEHFISQNKREVEREKAREKEERVWREKAWRGWRILEQKWGLGLDFGIRGKGASIQA